MYPIVLTAALLLTTGCASTAAPFPLNTAGDAHLSCQSAHEETGPQSRTHNWLQKRWVACADPAGFERPGFEVLIYRQYETTPSLSAFVQAIDPKGAENLSAVTERKFHGETAKFTQTLGATPSSPSLFAAQIERDFFLCKSLRGQPHAAEHPCLLALEALIRGRWFETASTTP